MKYLRTLVTLAAALILAGVPCLAQYSVSGGENVSRGIGRFVASQYNYPGQNNYITIGNTTTGSATITVQVGSIKLNDGRAIYPYNITSPIIVGAVTNQELVTPTAVSNCTTLTTPSGNGTCQITASFANTHGAGETLQSGTGGLGEAIYEAYLTGGGQVVLDNQWGGGVITGCTGCYGSANAAITALTVYPSVGLEDDRGPTPVYWSATPAASTLFTAPIALTSATVASSTTVAGSASYAAGTIHACWTPVDIMGNEGACSADYSFTDGSAKAVVFTAPPATTGAIGWIPYIGLESGAANNEYQVKIWTQPTVIGVAPVSSGVCTLSPILLQIGKYACTLTNTTYNQTGSGATVAAYPVVTSQLAPLLGAQSTASYIQPNTVARTSYSFAPGANPGPVGVVKVQPAATISTAAASTVPLTLGMVELPAGFMNYVGRSIEICGYAYSSTQGASTVVQIAFEWDAIGSNATTALPVIVGGPSVTNTLTTGTTGQFDFCQDLTTTVASASATGGSILAGHGYLSECALTTCATPGSGPNMTVAAVGSLNLAGPARIQVVMVQTTSSTAVPKLMNLSVKVLN